MSTEKNRIVVFTESESVSTGKNRISGLCHQIGRGLHGIKQTVGTKVIKNHPLKFQKGSVVDGNGHAGNGRTDMTGRQCVGTYGSMQQRTTRAREPYPVSPTQL